MLHFDLNVSILLKEYPFLERFDQAARLGFGAVEFWWPAGEDLAAWRGAFAMPGCVWRCSTSTPATCRPATVGC